MSALVYIRCILYHYLRIDMRFVIYIISESNDQYTMVTGENKTNRRCNKSKYID